MRLTKSVIDGTAYHGKLGTAHYLWDDEIPGFAVRLYPSGRKSFVLAYRTNGRARSVTLGRFGVLTLPEARAAALEVLRRIRQGEDPSGDRAARSTAPTVADLAERFQREHSRIKKKPASTRGDARNWKLHILPRLGHLKVADLTRTDVARLHTELAATPYTANRVLSLLSKAANLAEIWGWRPDGSNPTRHVERYREDRRERYLSKEEITRLAEVLREVERERSETPGNLAAIRLLLLTGCRVMEVLHLRWEEVDLPRRCLRLLDSKTGRKTLPLNSGAVQVLMSIEPVARHPYVFPGAVEGEPVSSLTRPWFRIRARAGLGDVRLHDLRHSYASLGAELGLSLPVLGKLLGHRRTVTTERYAHLADDPLRRATERVGVEIAGAMGGPSLPL